MIVLAPARYIAPCERRILAAADLKRPLKSWIGNRTGTVLGPRRMRFTRGDRRKRRQRQPDGEQTKRGGQPPQATRADAPFPKFVIHRGAT